MAHDDPFAGKTVNADWAYYLDTSGTYTPALTVESGTDPDLGADGTATGAWHRNGHLITGWAQFVFSGAGLSAGSGTYQFSLPFDADTSIMSAGTASGSAFSIGTHELTDVSALANSLVGVVILRTASTARMAVNGDVSVDSSTLAWAEGDAITAMFTYIADSAGLPA